MIKVAINGYGTIGKRVADAVQKQKDMKVIGVTKTKPDYKALIALEKGYKLFSVFKDNIPFFEDNGIKVEGCLEDLLEEADIVVDCSPAGVGVENKKIYEKFKKKAIFQGGEEAEVAEVSFVAQCNFKEAFGKNFVRVVSCNTTGLCRTLGCIEEEFGIDFVRVTLMRRGADPAETKKGPIDAIVLQPNSHHAKDVKTIFPHFDILTHAVKVPTTLMHIHHLWIKLKESVRRDDIVNTLEENKRLIIVQKKMGIESTAELFEFTRDLGRIRNDLYEVAVWDSIMVKEKWMFLTQAIHQEAIVIPENIDAIRAMLEIETDPIKSIEKTNKSLGILNGKIIRFNNYY